MARVKALKLKKMGLSQASDASAGVCLCAWWACLGLKSGCVREELCPAFHGVACGCSQSG